MQPGRSGRRAVFITATAKLLYPMPWGSGASDLDVRHQAHAVPTANVQSDATANRMKVMNDPHCKLFRGLFSPNTVVYLNTTSLCPAKFYSVKLSPQNGSKRA